MLSYIGARELQSMLDCVSLGTAFSSSVVLDLGLLHVLGNIRRGVVLLLLLCAGVGAAVDLLLLRCRLAGGLCGALASLGIGGICLSLESIDLGLSLGDVL